ncbi:MAG: LysR family transcriptional regulator [Mesorhizobium sp.]|nr:LysR family transcriptional regulator [Mesorhizobium sp.]MBL8575931.1 LysR family transcriptional regulator [Mesorhizobium sp.]
MNSIRHIELIVALGTHRHFGKAAEALGISQPALTKGIRHIENILGAPLFDRGGVVTPTVFGNIVLERGGAILGAFAELLREIELTKGIDSGRLILSAGSYPAEISGQEAVGLLSRAHPSILCEFSVKDWPAVLEDVLTARCDLGFADITEAAKHPELETALVRKCALLVVCRSGHPLTRLEQVTLEDIFEFPWAGVHIPNAAQALLPREQKPYGVVDPITGHGSPRLRVETVTGLKHIVRHSDALSALPKVLLDRDGEELNLTALPLEQPWLVLNYGFIWRRGRSLSPAAMKFRSLVHQIEKQANKGQISAPPPPL